MLHVSTTARRHLKAQFLLAASLFFLLPVALRAAVEASAAEMLQRVQQLIQQGDLTQARKEVTQALKQYPREAGLYNLLGVIEAQQGNYSEAEKNFEKAIAGYPRFAGAYLNLGRLYQENAAKDSQALGKGLETYEKLLKFEPDNVEANYQSAVLLLNLSHFQASLDRLSRLPAESQGHPQALAAQCADYAGLKERAQAQATAEKLLKHPDLAEADILPIVPVLLARNMEDLASELLEGLAGRHLASAHTLHQLALLYQKRGDLNRARATLEAVAQQKQSVSAPLLVELARVAYQQRDYDGTLGYLAHARDLDPNNAGIHFFFGIACIEKNLVEEASRSLRKAVNLNPDNPYYNYALGSVMMSRSNVREAYPYLKKYCELKPEDARGRLALGAAYFYGHDPELARKELEGVAGFRATAPGAHYFLGRLENQDGKFDAAMQELRKALEANPRYADAYAEMGLLQLKQKKYAEAEKALRRALEIDPEGYTANLNLMILYQRTKDARAEDQAKRFEEIKKMRAEREKEFLRTIEVRP
jgi:tetratricopeptide (TPR) repeat protein